MRAKLINVDHLCYMLYKVVSRILVTRLKNVIDELEQALFVPGRSISDNILLDQELAHSLESAESPEGLIMVKLDMERASDKMDWGFIFKVLQGMGFNGFWIIKGCVENPRL